jgi:hypothetical protein
MPIFHHDVAQYSDAYDRLTLGIPTSSHFHKCRFQLKAATFSDLMPATVPI